MRVRKQGIAVVTFASVAALMATLALPSYAYSEPEAEPVAAKQMDTVSVEVSDSAPTTVLAREGFAATTPAELASSRAAAAAAAAAVARRN